MSDYFSPYRFVAGTKFGVFAYFFIFWFLLDLVIYWGLLGFAYGRDYYSRFLDQSRLVTELETVLLEADAPCSRRSAIANSRAAVSGRE